ncbi:MAG TPA: cellulose synthase [Streptosporangiaceae bacterium]|nr:cellulose synthase [Streptosporangiaceae bacterium]
MGTWTSIATGTTCLIVTIVGLILSFLAWRKKGFRSGIRGVAWSLLPLAMYLTGAVGLVGRIGEAIVRFGSSFVFSPKAWLGVTFVGVSAVLFLVSGGIPLFQRGRKRERRRRADQKQQQGGGNSSAPAIGRGSAAAGDDDLSDVEEILRRRGIK